jgi:hypothetical protein
MNETNARGSGSARSAEIVPFRITIPEGLKDMTYASWRPSPRRPPPSGTVEASGRNPSRRGRLPTSQAEEQTASRLAEKAGPALEPVKQAAVESAQQLKEDATGAAQQAAQEVKETAAEAAKYTQEEARDQAGRVAEQAGESGRQVTDTTRRQPGDPM